MDRAYRCDLQMEPVKAGSGDVRNLGLLKKSNCQVPQARTVTFLCVKPQEMRRRLLGYGSILDVSDRYYLRKAV